MGQGRSSASQVMVLGLAIIMCVLSLAQPTYGASYTVGDADGWTFHAVNWPNGKPFKAGDVLEFNYEKSAHNVVAVDEAGYTSCNPQSGAKVYQTGKDIITLNKGANYFICSFRGHCELDMKIAANAA